MCFPLQTMSRHPLRVIICFTIGIVSFGQSNSRNKMGNEEAICHLTVYLFSVTQTDMLVGGIRPHLYCLPVRAGVVGMLVGAFLDVSLTPRAFLLSIFCTRFLILADSQSRATSCSSLGSGHVRVPQILFGHGFGTPRHRGQRNGLWLCRRLFGPRGHRTLCRSL